MAARRAAYEAVRRVHETGAWASPAVDRALAERELDERDRGFASNLAFQTLRWEGTLDWALGRVLTRPWDDVEPPVQDVLRLGAWQLLYGGTPDRAAVATAVELVKQVVGPRASGFVNGVLRGLARARHDLPWPDEQTLEGTALALGYPTWVVSEARARFAGDARAVLEAGNAPPGLTLRARGDAAALVAELQALGWDARRGRLADEAVRVPGGDPARLAAVAQGRATPQDEASMLVTRALSSGLGAPAGLMLDACAGPGGKATHLAELGHRVVAADLRHARAGLVARLVSRLQVGGAVHVVTADGAAPPWRPTAFDGVLVDAPCTGLGVVRRRPELRWRRSAADLDRLTVLQLALLEGAAATVRPGGLLVYSACTWTLAETVGVVRRFLAGRRGFVPEPPSVGPEREPRSADLGLQLRPDRDDTDGMYVACLRRNR